VSNISQQPGTQGDDISVCLQTYEKQYTLSRRGWSQDHLDACWFIGRISV